MIAGMGQPGVGAAQFLGDAGMRLRHALDVRLVDHRLVVRRARRAVGSPVEERVDDHAGHGVAQRVDHRRGAAGRPGRCGLQVVGVQRLGEVEVAVERLAVRVEQQLARIAAVPGRRIPRAVHPEAVPLARGDGRQVGVPDVAVDLVEVDPRPRCRPWRSGTARPARRPRRTARSWCPRRRRWRRADTGVPGHTVVMAGVEADASSTLSAPRGADRCGCHHQPVAAPI